MMNEHYCDRCGIYLPEGSIRYSIHIQILSDFDGVIVFDDGETATESAGHTQAVGYIDTADIGQEVVQELTYVLCGSCKQRFTRDPLNREGGFFRTVRKAERYFH
jgi:hypothetical protein